MVTYIIEIDATIRGIEREVYREFKAKAVRKGLNVVEAVAEALQLWIQKQ